MNLKICLLKLRFGLLFLIFELRGFLVTHTNKYDAFLTQACNGHSMLCVPLYDTLGNALTLIFYVCSWWKLNLFTLIACE